MSSPQDRFRACECRILVPGSLVLVLTQIFIVHALCALCLCSAAISFIYWREEVLAALGALKHGGVSERAGYGGPRERVDGELTRAMRADFPSGSNSGKEQHGRTTERAE